MRTVHDIAQPMIGRRRIARRSAVAFSLIELMIVLVIMGVLATSVTVSIRGAQDGHALRAAADDLAGVLRYGFEESRITTTAHRVVFAGGGSYRLEIADRLETVGLDGTQSYRPAPGVAGIYRNFPAGVRIVAIKHSNGQEVDDMSVPLLCVGGPEGFDGVIRLRNRRNETVVMEVLSVTGQVHVSK